MTRRRAPAGDASPLTPSPRAPWLGLTGILMLLAGFALYNGWFGYAQERWPWEVIADGGVELRLKAVLCAWLLAGLWATALAFVPARRTRAIGCALLAGILLTEGLQTGSVLTNISTYPLLMLLTTGVLGAGLLIARSPGLRGRGKLLAGAGGLLALWLFALPINGRGNSELETLWRHFGELFGDGAPSASELLGAVLPITLVTLAALGGLLAGLGLTGRRILLIGFFALLAAWLLATGTQIAEADMGEGLVGIGGAIFGVLWSNHLLLWLLVLFTVQDLANAGGGER